MDPAEAEDAPGRAATRHVVVMGVTGVGKSTIAQKIAGELDLELAEGDDFHPEANVAKMSSGQPLTDEDRWPWLEALAAWTRERNELGRGTVVTCSALKRTYRDVLRGADPDSFFVHLFGDEDLLRSRMKGREHFMPVSLLRSQFEALEPLEPDESGVALDVAAPVDEVSRAAVAALRKT
ncbi:MAG TPA: gluconokinase [Nocardioidaceae bacterium]|nr:gluconokinase [Nocardioidaceae bacterium]